MTLQELASFGALPGLLTLGGATLQFLQKRHKAELSFVERFCISCLFGGTIYFPILLATAWFGFFFPAVNGIAGWLIFLLGAKYSFRGYNLPTKSEIAIVLAAIALFAWNATYSTESIFSGRDQGVYSNLAAHIAQEHWLFDEPPHSKVYEDENRALLSGGLQGGGYSFDISKNIVYFQFPPTTALWMAQFFGMGEYNGLFAFNALLGSLNLLLLFCFVRRVSGSSRAAIIACIFFALNPAQVWNVRITLSEPLAQTLIIGGLMTISVGLRAQVGLLLTAGAILASANAFVRIDGLLTATGISSALTYWVLTRSENSKDAQKLTWVALSSAATALLAALYGFLCSEDYYNDFTNKIIAMVSAAIFLALLGFVPINPTLRRSLRSFFASKPFIATFLGALIAAAAYAYFVRPHVEPFAQFPEGKRLTGRDFRELSLVHLTTYLSLPVTFLGVAGVCLSFVGVFKRKDLSLTLLVACWATLSILYLYAPQISPDHPWRIRRYTPIIIPGFCIFAALAINEILDRLKANVSAAQLAAPVLIAFVLLVRAPLETIAFTKLHKGASTFIQEIAREIPEDALVVTDLEKPIFGALLLAEGKQTLRGLDQNEKHQSILKRLIGEELAEGRRIVYVTRGPLSTPETGRSQGFSFNDIDITKTLEPPATELSERVMTVFLTDVEGELIGYEPRDRNVVVGPHKILGVKESGLFNQENSGGNYFRWSEGNVRFSIPWIFDRPPLSLTFKALSTGPEGSTTEILANGVSIYSGKIPQSGAKIDLPIDKIDWAAESIELQILCDTWSPAQVYENATDSRQLGLQLGGFTFKMKRDEQFREVSFGEKPHFGIKESGLYETETIQSKSARWTNGSAKFSLEFDPDFAPQLLTIKILNANPERVPLNIIWNDIPLMVTEPLDSGSTLEIPLDSWNRQGMNTLELHNQTFVPSERDPNSQDTRKLGVMIESIEFR
ncbi:hypothetical protein [Pelagicoccus albus]|uniref:Glycosyltransferase RgtA/B/C/D-like domain-containing protein n=1 Tax=Pelagicoccus albus TaxID=415222 RepID=A0A7X1B8N7_9BACT|nr:hypothetical protein [Pelagicoccus albus]MBC2607404.1 hypothetical protein [Pelagicoccus albus]